MQAPMPLRLTSDVARVRDGVDRAIGARAATYAPWVLLCLLTVLAFAIRLGGLPLGLGTMGRDETRLALASRGILHHGYPLLPGGLVYTRGPLPSYLEAGSFALLGVSDQSARLPSLIAGALLVPAVYLLARSILGGWPALAVAALVVFSPPLVARSREAWFYSGFLLWFVLALACLHRSYRQPSLTSRLQAALAYVAAIFSHEYAVLFVPIALIADVAVLLGSRTPPARKQMLVFWSIVGAATAAVLGISLALRAPTLAGSMAEIRDFVQPHRDLHSLSMTWGLLMNWHVWPLAAGVFGAVVMVGSSSGTRRASLGFLAMSLALMVAFVDFILGRAGHERDQLMLIPVLMVLSVAGAQSAGPWAMRAFSGIELSKGAQRALATVVVALFVGVSVNPAQYWEEMQRRSVPVTWVQSMSGFRSEDLVMSYGPTVTSHYLGHTDFWLRSQMFSKYVWAGRPPYHDIHTDAVLIRTGADFDAQVLRRNAGRTMWVVWRPTESLDANSTPNEVIAALGSRLLYRNATPDGNVVLKVQL